MEATRRLPKLPEGYRLDLVGDPEAPALRGPDGAIVARFSASGMTEDAIEHEALAALRKRRTAAGPEPCNRSPAFLNSENPLF